MGALTSIAAYSKQSSDKADTLTTTFVVGATGMTGRSLLKQLLENNHKVRVVVRSRDKLSSEVLGNPVRLQTNGTEVAII